MGGGIERGEVSAEARTHEHDALAGGRALDDRKLRSDGEVAEVAAVEGGNDDLDSGLLEFFGEESGFARGGAGGEAV